MRRPVKFAVLATALLSGAAVAHPKLLSVSPAPNSAVKAPGQMALRFSEKLMPRFSGADVFLAGANGARAKIASTATVATDGHTLLVAPSSRLRAGRYNVAWHAVSADTHRVTGSYAFAVK